MEKAGKPLPIISASASAVNKKSTKSRDNEVPGEAAAKPVASQDLDGSQTHRQACAKHYDKIRHAPLDGPTKNWRDEMELKSSILRPPTAR